MNTEFENMALLNIEDYNELKAKAEATDEQIKKQAEEMAKPEVVTLKVRSKKSTIGSKNPIMGILEENKTFISSRPGCILCRLDEMESWAYLDDLLP